MLYVRNPTIYFLAAAQLLRRTGLCLPSFLRLMHSADVRKYTRNADANGPREDVLLCSRGAALPIVGKEEVGEEEEVNAGESDGKHGDLSKNREVVGSEE